MAVRHLVTAEELERMGEPEQGWDYELVRGELVPVMAAGRQHGVLTGSLTFELTSFVRQHGLGRVYTDGLGYKLFSNPDTVRVPDVSFVSREREPALRGVRGFVHGAPDLAVEVVSPDNTLAELTAKGQEYPEARGPRGWGGGGGSGGRCSAGRGERGRWRAGPGAGFPSSALRTAAVSVRSGSTAWAPAAVRPAAVAAPEATPTARAPAASSRSNQRSCPPSPARS